MKGAEAILVALADSGVDICFANPGTSEMQMVAAFDREPRVRPVLCLFEGVATGAADGFGRVAKRPASTLLHLGPGLANGMANLHNARRANSPIVNLVGDHATFHREYDAPLASDIDSMARTFSRWTTTAESADEAVRLAHEAVLASTGAPAGSATLILPADVTWSDVTSRPEPPIPLARNTHGEVCGMLVEAAARHIRNAAHPTILLGSASVDLGALEAAGRLSAAGIRVMVDSFVARLPRGEGVFQPERVPYFGEAAVAALEPVDLLVTVHSRSPAAFFGYPNRPSTFLQPVCRLASLTEPSSDAALSLMALAEALGAKASGPRVAFDPPTVSGRFNPHSIGAVIARHMPVNTLVSEDAATSGVPIMLQCTSARQHDWMYLTGGAIGQAIPVAIGAALAAPERKVIALSGDGAAAYTLQGLWTMARESLDVTTIVFVNHAYRILNIELDRTESGEAGSAARRLLDLNDPCIDWSALSKGWGVQTTRCADIPSFEMAFQRAMNNPGPHFIEVMLTPA
jgi:acetolactate synthase I/II/III large subunit